MQRLKTKNTQLAMLLLMVAAAIAVMMSLRQCYRPADSEVLGDGFAGGDTLNVAVLYGPVSYYVFDDTIGGFNYDVVRLMSKELNIPVKIKPVVDLSRTLMDMSKGYVGMVASLPVNGGMQKDYIFSAPLFLDRQVLIQKKGKGMVTSSLDLAGDSVHVAGDSPAAFRLENLSQEIGEKIHVVEHKGLSDEYLTMKVATGEIPLAVVNERIAARMQQEYPDLDYSTPISFTQFQSWVFAKRDSLKMKKVDGWLQQFKETAAYDSLLRKYDIK